MRKRIILFVFLVLVIFSVQAEKLEFPGILGIEFTCAPGALFSSNLKYNSPERRVSVDKLKLILDAKGSLLFEFKDFYTLYPWAQCTFLIENQPWLGAHVFTGLDTKFNLLSGSVSLDLGLNLQSKFLIEDDFGLEVDPNFFIQGKAEQIGLYWRVKNDFKLELNPEYFGLPNGETAGSFDKTTFELFAGLAYDVFNFIGVENVKCYIYGENTFKFILPYNYESEIQKTFENEMKVGILFDVAAVQPFAFFWMRTYDYYNSSAPLDGTSGSTVQWLDSDEWSADGVYQRSSRRLGVRTGIIFTRKWFMFNIEYFGDIEAVPGLFNSGGEYSAWKSKIELWFKFKIGGKKTFVLYSWEY